MQAACYRISANISDADVTVLRRSLREAVKVEARLGGPSSTSTTTPRSSDARGLTTIRRAGRSVSDPEIGDLASMRLDAKVRARIDFGSRSFCCLRLAIESGEGRENVTPFVKLELIELVLLIAEPMSRGLSMVVVRAVVVFGGLMTGGKVDSGRRVTVEPVEIFLRSDLSDKDGVREIKDSEGRVGSEGGMDRGGRVLVRMGWGK